jgi:hypothetical protein
MAVLMRAGLGSNASSTRCCRDTFVLLVAHPERATEGEQEEMLALDIREHQSARDPIEHVRRGRAAAALFSMLARCATSSRRRPGVRRRFGGKSNAAGSSFVRRSFK